MVHQQIHRSISFTETIFSLQRNLTKYTKKIMCETLVLLQFTYAALLYSFSLDNDTFMRVQGVRNSCLRYIQTHINNPFTYIIKCRFGQMYMILIFILKILLLHLAIYLLYSKGVSNIILCV